MRFYFLTKFYQFYTKKAVYVDKNMENVIRKKILRKIKNANRKNCHPLFLQ